MLDKQDGVCGICDLPIRDWQPSEVDRRISKKHGGTRDPDNLRVVHRICNKIKGHHSWPKR